MPWGRGGSGGSGTGTDSLYRAYWAQVGSFTADGTSDDVTTVVEAAATEIPEQNTASAKGILSTGTTSGDSASTAIQNYAVQIRDSTTGEYIDDGFLQEVRGVLSKAAGVWTLSYYKSTGATHSFSSQSIDFLFAEVFTVESAPALAPLRPEVFTDVVAGTGDFSGPASSTDSAIVLFDGTGGKTGKDSIVTIDGSGNIDGIADLTLTGTLDLSGGTLTLPQGTAPAPTAEGQMAWDTDDDQLLVGDGTSTLTFLDESNFLLVDGTRAGATSTAQDFGTNGIEADVIAESTASNGIQINGNRHYADSATDPSSPTPAEGDRYYNTSLEMEMRYDGSRSKWLSVETVEIMFGRDGETGTGAYFRGIDGLSFSSSRGRYAEYNGTVVSLSYTRKATTAATFEVTTDGTTFSTVATAAVQGSDLTLNDNFAQGVVLGARNQSGGNKMEDVMGWIRIKWRA